MWSSYFCFSFNLICLFIGQLLSFAFLLLSSLIPYNKSHWYIRIPSFLNLTPSYLSLSRPISQLNPSMKKFQDWQASFKCVFSTSSNANTNIPRFELTYQSQYQTLQRLLELVILQPLPVPFLSQSTYTLGGGWRCPWHTVSPSSSSASSSARKG